MSLQQCRACDRRQEARNRPSRQPGAHSWTAHPRCASCKLRIHFCTFACYSLHALQAATAHQTARCMPLRLIVRPAPALLHTLRSLAGTAQRQACGSALQAHHTPSSSSGGSAAKPPPLRCMVACSAGLPGTTSPAASSPAPQDAASNSGSEQDEDARLLSALAIPPAPGLCTLGARVEHVLAPREGLLSEVVTEALQLPQVRCCRGERSACLKVGLGRRRRQLRCISARPSRGLPSWPRCLRRCTPCVQGAAELLLRFGAIHTCPVPPALPPAVLDALPPEEAAAAQARRQAALERFGRSVSLLDN